MSYMEQKMQEQIEGAMHKMEEQSSKIGDALEVIKQAMIDDNPSKPGSYAHSWHCNLAMAYYDSAPKTMDCDEAHKIGNEAASRFMKLLFDVETKN